MLTLFMRYNKNFFEWINSYWFLHRSIWSYVTSSFYYLSLILFMLSLLDLRGPEKKVKGAIPDQRTIIIIDSSLSMLSEDVRPNRFSKAIQLARHFVKSSAGHQLSIVLFSDTQKRLIPFTDDIDLIDSRLAALEGTNSVGGGSNIAQAVSEAAAYFENDDEQSGGNILMFTDAEESDGDFKISIPSNINLAVVGVGTAKGGNIPLRYEDGSFKGYKSQNSQPVTTKLDETYIKNLGKNVKNYSYWIANSYSLPTEEILSFFRTTFNKTHNNGDLRIRPVFSHLILIPAIIFYCLSVIFGRLPSFKSKSLMIIFLLASLNSNAYSAEAKLPPDVVERLEKMKSGDSSHVYTLKTAEKLLRANKDKEAEAIYQEYLKNTDDEKAKFNYATSLLKQGKIKEAIPQVQEILKNSKDELLKSKLRKNVSLALNAPKQDKDKKNNQDKNDQNQQSDNKDQQNQDQKNNQNQKENKDNKNQNNKENQKNQQDQQKDQDQKNQQQKSGQQDQSGKQGQQSPNKNEPKDSKDKGQEKENKDKNKDKKEKDKKDGENEDENDQQKSPNSLEDKEKQIEQKRKMTKIPGMVKQIMNDDRELQKRLMDTSTKEKGELKPKNDW